MTLLIACHTTYKSTEHRYTVYGKISSTKDGNGIYAVSILYTKVAGTVTDSEGNFVIHGLPSGKYKLRFRTKDFLKKDTTIIIKDSNIYNLNIKMKEVKNPTPGDI